MVDSTIMVILDNGASASTFNGVNSNYLYINHGEIPGDLIDNDRNGLVDDYAGTDMSGYYASPYNVSGPASNNYIPYGTGHGNSMATLAVNIMNDAETIPGEREDTTPKIMVIKGISTDALTHALEAGAKVISLSYAYTSESWFQNVSDIMRPYGAVLVTYAGSTQTDSGDYSSGGRHYDNIIKASRITETGQHLSGPGVEFYEEHTSHSGAVAKIAAKITAIWSQKPELSLSELWDILEASSNNNTPLITQNNAQNGSQFGEVDLATAINLALNSNLQGGDPVNQIIHGSSNSEKLFGERGDDTLYGEAGVDSIFAGPGNDALYGGSGNDMLYGGSGNDELYGGAGADVINGGSGIDTAIYAGSSAGVDVNLTRTTQIGGHAQGDALSNIESVTGSSHGDTITGSNGKNMLKGKSGNDFLFGGAGNDTLYGGAGADAILGGSGWDIAHYGDSNTAVNIDMSLNHQVGGIAQGDILQSIEAVNGSVYNDVLIGDSAHNNFRGGNGNDILHGKEGNDVMSGQSGNDTLYGGSGIDDLYGNAGADQFIFEAGLAFAGIDNVKDFSLSQNDKLDVSDLLSGYDPLSDAIEDFVQITNNVTNSTLSVDIDGGNNNFVQIATLIGVTDFTDEEALETSGNLITV